MLGEMIVWIPDTGTVKLVVMEEGVERLVRGEDIAVGG